MTVWICCSELNVKASSSFASWADHLLLFVWSTANLQKNSGQRLILICPHVSTFFYPHTSILQHCWIFDLWFSNSLDQPILIQAMTFHCHLSSRAFWELRTLQCVFFIAFLCFEERSSGWPEKVDYRGCLFHQAYCCSALDLYSE